MKHLRWAIPIAILVVAFTLLRRARPPDSDSLETSEELPLDVDGESREQLDAKPASPQHRPGPHSAEVRGSFVRAEDGTPIANARVTVSTLENRRFELRTDTRGSFRFDATRATWARFVVHDNGRVRGWFQKGNRQLTGSDQVLAAIRVEPAVRLRGLVTDPQGQPLAAFPVSLEQIDGTWSNGTRSGPDGEFAIRETLAPGRYRVLTSLPWRNRGLPEIVLPRRPGPFEVSLRFERKQRLEPITGRVVDERGRPQRALIVTTSGRPWSRNPTATTTADGRFTIEASERSANPATLRVFAAKHRPLEVLRPSTPIQWGRDVELVVRREQTLRLFANTAGVAVERYFVRLLRHAPGVHIAGWWEKRADARHPGGHATIDGVLPGKTRLVVFPDKPTLWQSEPVEVVVGPELGTVRVEVQQRMRLIVHVVDDVGTPIADSRVQLIQSHVHLPPGDGGHAVDLAKASVLTLATGIVALDDGRTRANGSCELAGPRRGRNLFLRVTGSHVPHVERVSLAANEQRVTVQVRQPMLVRGRLAPRHAIADLFPSLRYRLQQSGTKHAAKSIEAQMPRVHVFDAAGIRIGRAIVAEDGSFAFEAPPGRVSLAVQCRRFREKGCSYLGILRNVQHAVVGATTRVILVDATRIQPLRRSAIVRFAGRIPPAGTPVLIQGRGDTNILVPGSIRTDAGGSLELTLPIGTYRATAEVAGTSFRTQFTIESSPAPLRLDCTR